MRIVGGRLRGRPLAGPALATPSARPATGCASRSSTSSPMPTACRAEETRVLDLFAGTGALGSRRSRAARRRRSSSRPASKAAASSAPTSRRFGLNGVTRILRRDATDLGQAGTIAPFDLVFCDPPYGKGLGEKALASAAAGGWLKPGALCVLEERGRCDRPAARRLRGAGTARSRRQPARLSPAGWRRPEAQQASSTKQDDPLGSLPSAAVRS